MVNKVGYGRYSAGKNNANIIVQDRLTGQLIDERMSVYVRLGMRLVYKGMRSGIQSKTGKRNKCTVSCSSTNACFSTTYLGQHVCQTRPSIR